ncbi:MAG: enoyl-ACP reductase [Armatimonadetes bacterium]|nr:enoyl-ACP reductase [Armatimonadota bacterium]
MKLLEGRKGLVFGVANAHSIAWAISQAAAEAGARLGFTFLNESLEKRVRPLAESLGSELILPCDVAKDEEISAVFEEVRKSWGSLDFLVHSVAFAQREDLAGSFVDTSRAGFLTAMEISAYSLVALARAAAPLMGQGGSIITLTYYGSQKVVRNYNVMGVAKAALEASVRYLAAGLGPRGIRVNAISAGPVKTLSAKGIRNFNDVLSVAADAAPLGRNITAGEVGKSAVMLLSDYSSGVTGDILYVDAGFNIKAF